MMGEPIESVARKMHGFSDVQVKIRGVVDPVEIEMIEPILYKHCGCILHKKYLVLYGVQGSMVADNIIKDKNSVVAYAWRCY